MGCEFLTDRGGEVLRLKETSDGWARGSPNVAMFVGRCYELRSAGNILGIQRLSEPGSFNDEEEVNLQH